MKENGNLSHCVVLHGILVRKNEKIDLDTASPYAVNTTSVTFRIDGFGSAHSGGGLGAQMGCVEVLIPRENIRDYEVGLRYKVTFVVDQSPVTGK